MPPPTPRKKKKKEKKKETTQKTCIKAEVWIDSTLNFFFYTLHVTLYSLITKIPQNNLCPFIKPLCRQNILTQQINKGKSPFMALDCCMVNLKVNAANVYLGLCFVSS